MKLKLPYGVDDDPSGGGFYWPASPSKRRELMSVKRGHPAVYESVYQCRPGTRIGGIFGESDFAYYQPPKHLHLGTAEPTIAEFCSRFSQVVIAWDTALEATHDSDPTVGIAAGLLPCDEYHRGEDPLIYGPCEPHFDVYLLDLIRKKLQFGDLFAEFRAFHRKWTPLLHVVEKKASGIQLYQAMPAIGINVEGVAANESKRARAVAGTEAGSTQGWFRQHRVRLPVGIEWVPDYKTELKDFTGQDDSRDDQVDSTVHLTNYAIETGSKVSLISSDWKPDNVDQILGDQEKIPEYSGAYTPMRSELLSWIQLAPEYSANPFYESCDNCQSQKNGFCEHWKRRVVALDYCEHFDARAVATADG